MPQVRMTISEIDEAVFFLALAFDDCKSGFIEGVLENDPEKRESNKWSGKRLESILRKLREAVQ